jgi:hypothetical protein
MASANALPSLRFALPLGSENRWSDLLAVLVETDPAPMTDLLGLQVSPGGITVRREASIDRSNRPDLVLMAGDRCLAVIEVKVLSGLGRRQLDRYEEVEPNADVYAVVFPQRLAVDTEGSPLWQPTHWESVIDAYRQSTNTWVRTTADAWAQHLRASMPAVDGTTQWNDLAEREDFVLAMRARMSWVFSHIERRKGLSYDLIGSTAGVSWVARMHQEAAEQGYRVQAELEERLPVRDYPKVATAAGRSPIGPSLKVVLVQHGVTTSAGFDWDYLLAMWPLMAKARTDWVQRAPRPKKHDRDNYRAMVAKGGPKYLGIGFGEAEARRSGSCMFGARIQLQADLTLAETKAEFENLSDLIIEMAKVERPATREPG